MEQPVETLPQQEEAACNETSEFNRGLSAALDPLNKNILKGGPALTTLSSEWFFRKCTACAHTFRLDDAVFITPKEEVLHDSFLLPCAGNTIGEEGVDYDEMLDYYNGVLQAYVPIGSFPANIITPGNETVAHLLAEPLHGFKRYTCGICSHTLRQNDIVVLCPCSPQNPRCRMAIHWDPFRGLNCWGEWSSRKSQLYCPAFSKKL